jgi:hypothetical protein
VPIGNPLQAVFAVAAFIPVVGMISTPAEAAILINEARKATFGDNPSMTPSQFALYSTTIGGLTAADGLNPEPFSGEAARLAAGLALKEAGIPEEFIPASISGTVMDYLNSEPPAEGGMSAAERKRARHGDRQRFEVSEADHGEKNPTPIANGSPGNHGIDLG